VQYIEKHVAPKKSMEEVSTFCGVAAENKQLKE
jgi:hypothetical protein